MTGRGFPDLRSLCPSFKHGDDDATGSATATSPNIPHMITVFKKIQNELHEIESKMKLSSTSSTSAMNKHMCKYMEQNHVNKLRLKKQILLSYFASFTDLQKEDIGFDPPHDAKVEQLRQHISISSTSSSSAAVAAVVPYNNIIINGSNSKANGSKITDSNSRHTNINPKRLEETNKTYYLIKFKKKSKPTIQKQYQ